MFQSTSNGHEDQNHFTKERQSPGVISMANSTAEVELVEALMRLINNYHDNVLGLQCENQCLATKHTSAPDPSFVTFSGVQHGAVPAQPSVLCEELPLESPTECIHQMKKVSVVLGGTSTDNGNLLNASALPCNCVTRSLSVYSYEERNDDHQLIRAEACGEVALHSLSRARRGL